MSAAQPCSALALAAGETLPGKATVARHWVLLEHGGPWPRRAEDVKLPAEARHRLFGELTRLPDARFGLIRRSAAAVPRPHLLVADTAAASIRQVQLGGYSELAQIDLGSAAGWTPVEGPLFLVCVHAVRDRCCGRFGPAVWQAVRARFRDQTWQTTHVGGHRFAPNLVALPHGYVFSRLSPAEAGTTADLYAAGQLDLEHCRGRAALAPGAQAAEVLARRQAGADRIDTAVPDLPVRLAATVATAPESCGGEAVPVRNYSLS